MKSRTVLNAATAFCALLLLLLFARLIFAPDAGAKLFFKAQSFENAGQTALALSHYETLAQTQPQSVWATRSLLKIGDLRAMQGRASGDRKTLRAAVAAYEKLATLYPGDPLASEALLSAGQICAENLKDASGARRFYGLLLKNAPPSSEAAAQATLKLGVLALEGGEKAGAQELLQRVLQKWPKNLQTASEAQFRLGVLYETLFKNREWATRAYDAVIANYPFSPFANNARGRLGLLAFADAKNRRPARRVMLEIAPLPADGAEPNDGSLWNALPLLLAARGVEADALSLRAWSLEPFFCALNTQNPGAWVEPTFDDFENAVANVGLKFTVKGGGKPENAMEDLQNDLDSARLPLVFYKSPEGARWGLCIGYDSQTGELFLQESGAQFQTLSAKTFAASWNTPGLGGRNFTSLVFFAPGEQNRPKPDLTPIPTATPKPNETPLPVLENTPSFVWKLESLSRRAAHAKTIRRAAILLERTPNGAISPNIAGLSWLESAFRERPRTGRPLQTAPEIEPTPEAPTPPPELGGETDIFATPDPLATPEVEATPVETLAPTPRPREIRARFDFERTRAALAFLKQPAKNWVAKRREAARYLRLAASQTGRRAWNGAAQALEQSALRLETASDLAADIEGGGETQTDELRELRRLVSEAREAEERAAKIMR